MKNLELAIEEIGNGFSDYDEIHDFEIRLDVLCYAMADFLKDRRSTQRGQIWDYEELLKRAGVEQGGISALRELLELVQAKEYGESLLLEGDLDEANELTARLHEELEKWFKNQARNK